MKFRKPSPAMVVASAALFVALAGGAYASVAVNQVRSVHIKNGEVRTVDLANNAVTSIKLKNNAVRSASIKDGVVSSADLADGGVATADLADGAVTGQKVADGSVGLADLAPGTAGHRQVVVRERVFTTEGNSSYRVTTIACAAGETAVAGGGVYTPLGTRALSASEIGTQTLISLPATSSGDALIDGQAPEAWLVSAQNVSGATRDFHGYAVCVK